MPLPLQRNRINKYPSTKNVLTVTRPGPFGNPYVIVQDPYKVGYRIMFKEHIMKEVETKIQAQEIATSYFREYILKVRETNPQIYQGLIDMVRKADFIACWCRLDEPCHRSVWIELAKEADSDAMRNPAESHRNDLDGLTGGWTDDGRFLR